MVTHYDRDEMSKKLLEWADQPTSLTILGFCAKNNVSGDRLMEWNRNDEDFAKVYSLAKLKVGYNRFLSQNNITAMEYSKNLRYYDPFYKSEMIEKLEYESELSHKYAKQLKQFEHDLQNSNNEEMGGKILEFLERMNATSIADQSK